jgi:hypothetical protein
MGQEKVDVVAVVATVRALVAYCGGKSGHYPAWTNKSKDLAKRLLGIWWQPATKDWYLEQGWKDKLALAGIDPDTLLIQDPMKLQAALVYRQRLSARHVCTKRS